VAGFEIRLSSIRKTGMAAVWVSAAGIVIPFAIGGTIAWTHPHLLGIEAGSDPVLFAFFVATAMSISALPVIAKTLFDLGIYDSRVGTVSMAAAVLDDIVGWTIFSVVLSGATAAASGGLSVKAALAVLAQALFFALVMITVGTRLFEPCLAFLSRWSKKMLSFCLGFALLAAALTEWIGIHALLGSFIAGVSMGNTQSFDDKTRETVTSFVNSFFAPIFIALLGLKCDFIADFNFTVVAMVLVIACIGKIAGCGFAARLSGMSPRDSLSVGFAMNARGAMEIILGGIALQQGLIGKPLYEALVVMALSTSAMAGVFIPGSRPREGDEPSNG
jgi:Kef-type K+ transport system membrane component KefB